jgi:putative transposase
VYVPKVGWIRIFQSQTVDCPTKSATFKRDACGHWFVTLTAEFELPDVPLSPVHSEAVIGVDAGLKDFIVLSAPSPLGAAVGARSDGQRVAAPKFYRKGQRKLKRAQRQLSKRKKGSQNRNKAKKRVARIHKKISHQRQDFLHKLSTTLVREHDGVAIEDLNLKGLVKTKLAKSFNDASHGEFKRQLEYKSLWNQKWFVKIGRFFPSSKLHAACGTIKTDLTLSDRYWLCACGALIDRDANAALNIKLEGLKQMATMPEGTSYGQEIVAAGQTETLNACGAYVRLSLGAMSVEARIPRL